MPGTLIRHKIFLIFLILIQTTVLAVLAQDNILKFDHLTVNNGLPQNTVYSIVKDKFGFLWFGTWGGACRYDGYSIKVFRANENDTSALPDNRINAIVTDNNQNIWIQTGESRYLYKYNYEYENFTRYNLNHVSGSIKKLLKRWATEPFVTARNNQYIWLTNHKELRQTNRTTGKYVSYVADSNNPFSLSDNIINYMYLDDSKNLWIGTQNGGVNHASLNVKPFSYYNSDKDGNGLIENVVRAVCKDKTGRVWIGSENKGLTVMGRTSKGWQYHYFREKEEHFQRIRSIYCDKQGVVWIGTKGGLLSYNPHTNVIKKCSQGICDPNVFAMLEDHNGSFWVGTFNGLARYDRTSDRFDCLGTDVTGGKQIRAIIEDHHRNLWVATEDKGLTRLERTSSNTFKSFRYIHQEGSENSLINNRTYSLAEDNDGMIWIATNSGLSRLNPTNNTFRHFTIKNGLPDDIIMAVLFDGKESVWISHKKGLTRINTRTFELQSFNMYDGLQGNEFTQNVCFRDNLTGEMFFGGTNGLNSFFPDSFKINRIKPRIVFTQLNVMNQILQPGTKINGKVILEKSLLCTNEITLRWEDKTFRLEFAALHFANPLGNKYKYKLEGFDKQWNYTDASMRTASYTQLPAGTYVFKVYAANSDGVWSDTPATLRIKVLPPWWLSWWAIGIYFILTALIIWFIYKYIVARIEFRKNEEIHRAKLQFFTEVSHEFRTPLTLIIDPLEKLITENPEKDTVKSYYSLMHRNAKQLLMLINQLLDFRKLESGHFLLNLQEADIVSFVRTTVSSFETRANERNIQFSIQTSVDRINVRFDNAKLNMVLNNLLSNAFKFTSEGGKITVSINISASEKDVMITVRDTGIGIPKEDQKKIFDIFYQSKHATSTQEGSGIGLTLTKELVQLHGGKLLLESEPGKGSCFTVILPIISNQEVNITEPPQTTYIPDADKTPQPELETSSELPLVLVVDDNADIRKYIELNFRESYRIVIAANGAEGFQQATETIPDIVVSDIMMPGTDGLELCRMLKSDERTSHIPVILLTARQSDESKLEGFETGADAYITKPFNTTVLKAQIQNLLEQRQRLRELFSKGSALELKKIAINIFDETFLAKVTRLVEENLEDENFDIDTLAEKLKMSRSQFYRKIKALTNKSLHDFVTTLRMNKAVEYLLSGEYNISETAYKVGFSVPNNFTRTFTKHFGTTPSKYINNLKK